MCGRMTRYLLGLLLVCTFATSSPQGFAHAVLLDSSPKPGEMLMQSPSEVVANFNEGVGPIFFKVLDVKGQPVGDPGEIRLDGTKMILPLRATLPNGTYVLTYRVISADTHPVGATFGFSIGEPMKTVDATADAGSRSIWSLAVAVNRWVLYAGMLWVAGTALFLLLLGIEGSLREDARQKARWASVLTALSYVLAVGFGGADMQLGGVDALWKAATWRSGLDSTLASSAVLGLIAMALLYAGFVAGEQRRHGVLIAGATLAIGSFLVTGHAATAPPAWLMAPVVGVHLLATAFWIGAFRPLLLSTGQLSAADSGALMQRFSNFAVPAVIVVLISGTAISLKQLGSPAKLFDNDYGTVLLTKIILVLVIIGIAAYNKINLTPRLIANDVAGVSKIRRTITLELMLYVIVLAAASALTVTTPPRALVATGEAGAAEAKMAMMSGGLVKRTLENDAGYSAEIELSPAKVGENMLMVTVKDPAGVIVQDATALEVTVALETAGISEVRLKAEAVGNGMWHVMIGETLIPGDWALTIDGYLTDYDKTSFSTTVTLK
ncbi:MAG: copper resistance CopC/CopD family protein [Steroidobacteraceae bacterium]